MSAKRNSYVYTPPVARRSIRVTLTSPTRTASVYKLSECAKTANDIKNPRLLGNVVHEEELKGIVSRLTRPTMATRMRAVNFRPQTQYTFVDMGHYKWNSMHLYTDYQRQMYTSLGAVQPGFKRTVKATYRPFFC